MTDEHKELLRVLNYEPITGIFTYTVSEGTRKKEGEIAGGIKKATTGDHNNNARRILDINYKKYAAHRLAFLFMQNHMPTSKEIVLARDGDLTNTSFSNLYITDNRDKQIKTKTYKSCKTGIRGVAKRTDSKSDKWRVTVRDKSNKRVNIGSYSTIDEAIAARENAMKKYEY